MTATLDVMQAFPTVIGRWMVPDADLMNEDLQTLILKEESRYASLGRSNIGGWHSRTDFLNHSEPAVTALTSWITWAVNQMIAATAGPGSLPGTVSLSAWATICRNGSYHAPHSHPDSAWSGVYYVDAGTITADRVAQWRAGVHRSTRRRGSGNRAGRSVRGTCPGPAASRAHRDLSELALSLGPSLCGAHPTHRGLVQCHAKRRLTEMLLRFA
jgi:hypothetical protein